MRYQDFPAVRSGRLVCRKCGYIKPPVELVDYGHYRLCRDCARKFESSREKEESFQIEDFVLTR